MHTQTKLDAAALNMARRYARWFYVSEAPFRANDLAAANPWNVLSKYLDELCT